MKQIKYINYWLEAVYAVFLYILIAAALALAPVSRAFYVLPLLGILWKFFSYHIVLPDFVRGRRLRSAKKYNESLAAYEKCLAILLKRPWLDRYKFWFMASSLRLSLVSIVYSNITDLLALCDRPAEARKRASELCRIEPMGVVSEFFYEKYHLPRRPLYENSFPDLKELLSGTVPGLELLHVAVCLTLLVLSLFTLGNPFLLSLTAALIVGVYFFWRFGILRLVFRNTDAADDELRLEAALKALELLDKKPWLDALKRVLFLSVNRISYRDCFLSVCFMLYMLKDKRDKAAEYAELISDVPVRDECRILLKAGE